MAEDQGMLQNFIIIINSRVEITRFTQFHQTRRKCFKHVANVQNTFIIFKTRLKCFKRVLNVSITLLMFQSRCYHVANIQHTFIIFKTHLKCFKHIVNVRTALYLQRLTNSRKK